MHNHSFCGKCGERLYKDCQFCSSCGNQIIDSLICPKCEKELHPNTEMCPECGFIIDNIEQEEKNKTLIETVEQNESNNDLSPNTHEKKPLNSKAILSLKEEETIPEFTEIPKEVILREKNIKQAKSYIQVCKIIILIIGVIVLVQNFFLLSAFLATRSSQSQQTTPSQSNRERGYRDFGNRNRNEQRPKILQKTNIAKILFIIALIGILQGATFIYLHKLIDKKPFIAILIAFIFEITSDIVKIFQTIIQMFLVKQITIGQFSYTKPIFLSILQIILITGISVTICFFLGKGLQKAIKLRKMDNL